MGAEKQKTRLESGTYEIIKNRLQTHSKELTLRLEKLNQTRKQIFGSIEHKLIATERVSTENNCTPRDIACISDDHFIFGYNVHMGLKSQTKISDVFGIYQYKEKSFSIKPLDMLDSGSFKEDFSNLYKYYKETKFAKFYIKSPYLFMVFNTGKSSTDIKTFKWLLKDRTLTYVDNRSDHEYKLPPQHDYTWQRTTLDQHCSGEHPHISLEDRLFVEAVGGDITFKI